MMKIIPLSEGSFTVDATKKFIPFDKSKDRMEDRGPGALLVEIQPFVLVTSRDIILLDAGLGFRGQDGILQIHQNMVRAGINPQAVTKVLISHLHKDHAGGLGMTDPQTRVRAFSFSKATYYVNKRELEFAFAHDGKSYHSEDFEVLTNHEQVVQVDGEGMIGDEIHYEMTGGHCPYHQVFLVNDGQTRAFFGGDVAPQMSQMKNRFIATYDFDGRLSMQLRQQFAERGRTEDWTFLFYHDTRLPFAKMEPPVRGSAS